MNRLDDYRVSCVRRAWYETVMWERGHLAEPALNEPVPAMSEHVVHALIRDAAARVEAMRRAFRPPEGF